MKIVQASLSSEDSNIDIVQNSLSTKDSNMNIVQNKVSTEDSNIDIVQNSLSTEDSNLKMYKCLATETFVNRIEIPKPINCQTAEFNIKNAIFDTKTIILIYSSKLDEY